ncbi:MAG: SDR family NAD(P)-dependent oxidoreductase [Nocardioides sp.]|uniref:SDR family NAD(P)-dependent oxidoreductase n=1 Tax=Nocardioides sp. TaxID=35761 RepID=UPI003264A936
MNAAQPLAGRHAIVTGAGGGMGRAHALRLARLGADVVVVDRDLDAWRRWDEDVTAGSVVAEIEALGRRSIGVEADLSDQAGAEEAMARAVDAFGSIDVIVNNAGGAITPIGRSQASISTSDDIEVLWRANMLTTVNCCRAAAPHLTRPGASVVNIATGGVDIDTVTGSNAVYASVKAAVVRYTRSLAVELGPSGIRANCISPGLIETARIKALAAERGLGTPEQVAGVPLRRFGTTDDVAGVVEFLATDLSGYVTGECIRVTGGTELVMAMGS